MNAQEIAYVAAENLDRAEGFGAWRVVTPARWKAPESDRRARASIEILLPGTCAIATAHLVADREPVEHSLPVFDDGAAADRAHDAEIDRQNGVDL